MADLTAKSDKRIKEVVTCNEDEFLCCKMWKYMWLCKM